MAAARSPVSRSGGQWRRGLVAALILRRWRAVALRAEGGGVLGPADWAAVRFTVWQAFLSALISVALAMPVARALARRRFVGRRVLMHLVGCAVYPAGDCCGAGVAGGVWSGRLAEPGCWGVGAAALSIYGLQACVLAHVFFNLPLATRLILQGWQGIPAERFRLAAQLGLTPRVVFRVLEWPLLRRWCRGRWP